jgi:hypothetical protein
MASIISKLFQLKEQIILVFMLELLHFSLWTSLTGPLATSLLLMHLGLFLLWQPIWRGDENLKWYDVLLVVVITYTFVFQMQWWLIFAWTVMLIALAGGRITVNRKERTIYMITLVFLVFELLIRCTPMLFDISVASNVSDIFAYILPVLPLLILILHSRMQEIRFHSVDVIHAISISTLTSLLVAGALLNMYRTQTDYVTSLIQTLLVIGVFLLAISWLLIPRTGFSGLPQLWLKAMLNIGTPFESFLHSLSIQFKQKSSPVEFLAATMDELIELPWIEGVEWKSEDIEDNKLVGTKAKTRTELEADNIVITIYSYTPVSGSLYLHCKLLAQLISIFYTAKVREREMTQQTHMQAVYETGARITHDIKNLLQSLQALTSIIINDSEQDNFVLSGRLLKKQLPALTQRLKLALEKLQEPDREIQESVYLKDWWNDLKLRIDDEDIDFVADLSGDHVIPAELFDSAIDNLFENIKSKSKHGEKVKITTSLYSDEHNIVMHIVDNGRKIREDVATHILKEPVQSDNGLGIGLYQVARQADSLGYKFLLKDNFDGNVCFELSKQDYSGQFELI